MVEVVFVVVILGIVATIGSSFVVTAIDSYNIADTRNKLVQRGRLTLEQIARELRMAVPNSIRISSSNRCLEFLPIIVATNYRSNIATSENNASPKSFVNTSSYNLIWGTVSHAVIAAYNPSEVYTIASPASRVSTANISLGSHTKIDFGGAHRFLRDSQTHRIFIAADPVRFCALNNNVMRISNYGFDTGTLTDTSPVGTVDLMAQNVQPDGVAFELSPGSEDRNISVAVRLMFNSAKAQIDLQHQVLIRNVP